MSDKLVAAAVAKLGSENAAELAKAIGLPGLGKAEARARRWIQGRNEPDYEGTVRLLEYVGWLRVDEKAAPTSGHEGGGSDPMQAGAAAAMAEAARVLEEAGHRLLALAADLQPPQPGSSRRAG